MRQPEDRVERAQQIQAMFGKIVTRYDLLNRLMSLGLDRGWRRSAAALAAPRDALVLDLGAGTGDLTRELLRQEAREVISADFSPEMLAAGSAKLQQEGRQVSWLVADATRLPFADESFDRVISGFLLRNLVDLPAGLQEMVRVLKPGGRFVSLDITHPPRGKLEVFHRVYFQRVLPRVGGLVSGNPAAYRYLPNSLTGFPDPEQLSELLRQVGLKGIAYRRMGLGAVALHHATKES